jgi:hypothetical protein
MQAGQGSAVTRVRNWPAEQPGVWIGVTISTLSQVTVSSVRYWWQIAVSKRSGVVTVWTAQPL